MQTTVRATIPDPPTSADVPVPGLVLVFSGTQPVCKPIRLENGAVVLGRGGPTSDEKLSRRHARIAYDGAMWTVEDLGSTNGTWVDDEEILGEVRRTKIRVIQAGTSVFLPMSDIRRFLRHLVRVEKGVVQGPALQEAHAAIARAASSGDSMLVTGESGTGKELAARAYHQAGAQSNGPFVPVNCAAIPEGLAERLLFGARRGAYSGATHDTEGYVQAAHNGTLFLDEVAELDSAVQAKLLRTIDTQQVLELGAVSAKPVRVRVCAATHDLRARVAADKFREDLYYRIGRPEIHLPPLRDRPEEIPWHLAECCKHVDVPREMNGGRPPVLSPSLVVAALLRRWPGNVRELLGEARRAAARAIDEERVVVEERDLDPRAGIGIGEPVTEEQAGATRATPPPSDETYEAMVLERGNVSRAARRLGIHRNKVRRWMDKYGVKRSDFE
ncbi:sigma 54-interacting transcriptional regulator [Chondromyces crocatus]|uniref:Sigma-54 dependent transcriptional regulator n=1 Tax=Chondromyces crocatus TaxID=52 RepID=A0A0K1EGI1_CHOCO|nr:sigma 54-interacting transcriptional regulator [Chondromyces crocatus]AKT39688.1 sigma-54 dependent transcriptional regulator [Chondromyces crocatus]